MNKKQSQTLIRFLAWMGLGMALVLFQSWLLPAQPIPPGEVKISTPAYSPSPSFKPMLGRYDYSVSWNGIPAASLSLEVAGKGDDYELIATAQTAKAIDIIYKLRYYSRTILAARTLTPKRSISVTRANDREKRVELEFLPNGQISSVQKDKRGKEKNTRFGSTNFTLDPYSAGFLALSQDWKAGDVRRFDTYNGKHRYLIELTALEQTDIEVNGVMRQAIVIRPSVKKLTTTDPDPKKLREARIYISTGDAREILKITSEVFIGSVNTNLVSFTPEHALNAAPAVKPE